MLLLNPRFLFPQGKTKALTFSYDDGSEHDRRLLEIFNRYGLKGTFNLNSGHLNREHYVRSEDVASLYSGHEIASHTVNHFRLPEVPEKIAREEIVRDREELSLLTGYPVRGFVFPFNASTPFLLKMLPETGIRYARGGKDSQSFALPDNELLWAPTCHHNRAEEFARRFLDYHGDGLLLFYVWGHSYEWDGFMSSDTTKDWTYLENFARMVGKKEEIWYATNGEIYDYIQALKQVKHLPEKGGMLNSSSRIVWIKNGGQSREIPPGEFVSF